MNGFTFNGEETSLQKGDVGAITSHDGLSTLIFGRNGTPLFPKGSGYDKFLFPLLSIGGSLAIVELIKVLSGLEPRMTLENSSIVQFILE